MHSDYLKALVLRLLCHIAFQDLYKTLNLQMVKDVTDSFKWLARWKPKHIISFVLSAVLTNKNNWCMVRSLIPFCRLHLNIKIIIRRQIARPANPKPIPSPSCSFKCEPLLSSPGADNTAINITWLQRMKWVFYNKYIEKKHHDKLIIN